MGWTHTRKPESVSRWLKEQLTWDTSDRSNVCIKTCVRLREAYAAVETYNKVTGERHVWAAVYLLDHRPAAVDGYDFGYKDMDETCGPYVTNCPESILNLLTPTDHVWADTWRQACRTMSARKKYRSGDTLRLKDPLKFINGAEIKELVCVDKRKGLFTAAGFPGTKFRPGKTLVMLEYEIIRKGK